MKMKMSENQMKMPFSHAQIDDAHMEINSWEAALLKLNIQSLISIGIS